MKCKDPCPGTCGLHARCRVVNHNAICSCNPGFVGDPFVRCIKEEESKTRAMLELFRRRADLDLNKKTNPFEYNDLRIYLVLLIECKCLDVLHDLYYAWNEILFICNSATLHHCIIPIYYFACKLFSYFRKTYSSC